MRLPALLRVRLAPPALADELGAIEHHLAAVPSWEAGLDKLWRRDLPRYDRVCRLEPARATVLSSPVEATRRPLVVVDLAVGDRWPSGSLVAKVVRDVAGSRRVEVISVFNEVERSGATSRRVLAPHRPMLALLLGFRLAGGRVTARACRALAGERPIVQATEAVIADAEIRYAHFCHRSYLRHHWRATRPDGVVRALRWSMHALHARWEPAAYRRAKVVVAASHSLRAELIGEYPDLESKIRVIANPVDAAKYRMPQGFDRESVRRAWGVLPSDVLVSFVALGHFERKGLPLLMAALQDADPRVHLLVVGGERKHVASYRDRAAHLGIADRVHLVGWQSDVRPYLWAADVFALPSAYEVWPLVVLQAAAAGRALLVSAVGGVAEIAQDGDTAVIVEHTRDSVSNGYARLVALGEEGRRRLGERAAQAVAGYDIESFLRAWRELYSELDGAAVEVG